MRFCVHLSGTTIFETKTECIPSIGSIVRCRTTAYKKGLNSGSVIEVTVTADDPLEYDFTEPEPVVYLSANGYEVVSEGPAPD